MPKDLFFTLPADKQKKIIDSSMIEFSEHRFHEASINQIIKIAGISRGSFYQYFEDKEDLYFFQIKNILELKIGEYLINYVKSDNTSVFTVNRHIFMSILSMVSDEKYRAFYKNMFLSMTYELEKRLMRIIEGIRNKVLSNNFETDLINIGDDRQYLNELLQIIALINKDLLSRKVIEDIDDTEIIKLYDLRMELLRSVREIKKMKYTGELK